MSRYKIRYLWEDCYPEGYASGLPTPLKRCPIDGGWLYRSHDALTFVADPSVRCVADEGERARREQYDKKNIERFE